VLWRATRDRLRARLGADIDETWFTKLTLVDLVNGEATISGTAKFIVHCCESNFGERLLSALRAVDREITCFRFVVKDAKAREPPVAVDLQQVRGGASATEAEQ
jgi:chromosomal replication initiation ATPase DnaA